MATIDDIVLQMKILTNKITVFRSTITSDMTTESQARINYDEYLRDLVQGLQDQISSIDITNNTAGIMDVINAVSTAIDSHQLVLSPQATIRAIKRIAPLNGGAVNITEDANNIFIHGEGNGISRQRIVRYTESATLKLSDANCIIECDSTNLIVLTVPAYADIPFKSAVLFDIVQINTGGVQVVGAYGVTIEASGDGLAGIDTSGLLYLSTEPNRFIFSIAGGSGVPDGGTAGQALLKQSGDDGDATWQTLTKGMVGLSNVDNIAAVDMPVSTAQAAADTDVLNTAKTYADNLVVGLFDFRGSYDASTGLFPTVGGSGSGGAVLKGDIWRIYVAGTIGGVALRVGDSIYAAIDTPAQVVGNWGTILLELGYSPEDVARKAIDLLSPDNIKYPTTLAVSNALETQRVKYWEEVSTAIDASTQRLAWRPKDPNGTFVRANTVQVIATPRGLTLRDPLESGSTFPTAFTTGLDLQLKGTTGTNATYAMGGYCFGEGNTAGLHGVAVGLSNGVPAAATRADGGVVFGRSNTLGTGKVAVLGIDNTIPAGGTAVVVGQANNMGNNIYGGAVVVGIGNTSNGIIFGNANNIRGIALSQYSNMCLGNNNIATSGDDAIVIGKKNTQTNGGIIIGGGTFVGSSTTGQGSIIIGAMANQTDQGLTGFCNIGRTTTFGINGTNTLVAQPTLATDTSWKNMSGVGWALQPLLNNNDGFFQNFYFSMKVSPSGTSPAGTQIPARFGVVLVKIYSSNNIVTPLKVELLGGDTDFFTYFNFRAVLVSGKYVLQYSAIADPTGAATSDKLCNIYFRGYSEMITTT